MVETRAVPHVRREAARTVRHVNPSCGSGVGAGVDAGEGAGEGAGVGAGEGAGEGGIQFTCKLI